MIDISKIESASVGQVIEVTGSTLWDARFIKLGDNTYSWMNRNNKLLDQSGSESTAYAKFRLSDLTRRLNHAIDAGCQVKLSDVINVNNIINYAVS